MFSNFFKYLLLCLIFAINICYGETIMNQKIISDSKTESVILFLNGAQVTRNAKIELAGGNSTLVFTGLAPSIYPESIQVGVFGKQRIVSVVHRINYLEGKEKSERVIFLTEEFNRIIEEINVLNAEAIVLKNEWDILMANKDFSKKESVNVEDLKNAVSFFKSSMTEISAKQLENSKKVKELKEKQNALEMELRNNLNSKSPVSEVVVEVFSEEAGECDLSLSYYISSASWRPFYDIRTQSDSNVAILSLKAYITQDSLEDWNDISLTLSSGNPSIMASEPRLSPWYLRADVPVVVFSAQNSRADMKVMDEYEAIEEVADVPAPVMPSSVNENQASLEFILNNKVSIPGGNTEKIIDVLDYKLNADYKYYAVRKLEEGVFLLAVIDGWQSLNLLSGEVNVFLGNSFVGKTYIDPRKIKDNLEISLGRDKSVTITRVKGADFKDKTFIGGNIKETRSFDITVRNLKSKAISVTVLDQVPVSVDKTIVVDILETTGASLNKETGELSWVLNIPAGKEEVKKFKYIVTYPKNKTLILE